MRSTVQQPDPSVKAAFNPALSDKYVEYGIFIPKKIDFTSRYFDDLTRARLDKMFTQLKKSLTSDLKQVRKNFIFGKELKKQLDSFIEVVKRCSTFTALLDALERFFNSDYFNIELLSQNALDRLFQYKYLDASISGWPLFTSFNPNAIVTSEIGLLFLDRTRLRPAGFCIGEHVMSVSIGPGDELTLEQKSSFKETRTFENTLEREYELTLENTSESAFKNSAGAQSATTRNETGTTSGNAAVNGNFESLGVPVDASTGVSGSTTTQESISLADNASSELSRTYTDKVSSRLRKNHKISITETTETFLETSSKRVIRNLNKGTAVTYNFFKVMQQTEAQVQRKGINLCWAPFVRTPGRTLLQRMSLAERAMYYRAKTGIRFPVRPPAPFAELAPVRKWGAWVKFRLYGVGISEDHPAAVHLSVTVADGDIYAGEFKVDPQVNALNNGGWSYERTLTSTDGDNESMQPRQSGNTFSLTVFVHTNGFDAGDIWFRLGVDVIPKNTEYPEELEAYIAQLQAWYNGVANMANELRESVAPDAKAARQQVLDNADIRSELLHAVIDQYIRPSFRDEAVEVELWHRIFDFDNIGYKLFPNWWNHRTPVPESTDSSFLNASWARVFLPVRQGYEDYAAGLIFGDPGLKFLKDSSIKKDLEDEREKLKDNKANDPTKIGEPWTLTTPTDGTHIETMLSATNSMDDDYLKEISQNVERAKAEIDNLNADVKIKQLVNAAPNTTLTID